MGQTLSQALPASPKVTEKTVPNQSGKVVLVTGGTGGIGRCLAGILYNAGARVWITGRSDAKGVAVVAEIRKQYPTSTGDILFLRLDYNDLATVKKSAQDFLVRESRLNVLFNNAGIMFPPKGAVTAQGYDQQFGTNALATFLFTKLVTPLIQATAKTAPSGESRIVWVSSSMADFQAPNGGVELDNLNYKSPRSEWVRYGISKAALMLYAAEAHRRLAADNITNVVLDPGVVKSDLLRDAPSWFQGFARMQRHDTIYGAYTELFAGFSADIKGKEYPYVIPWGRIVPLRKDIAASAKPKSQGGTGVATEFWDWTEREVAKYV
ncbi:hypothetical protein S40285_02902 [Stachybotrys chlorohalonatus IBT 40285]|uniref:Uncharacterized protein n=1 Tax=Stachybotrys chlorohalonatus (strain IBT 40285) TaxID=1283841 RepID=A0A084QK53_STAC4|nr:hypothetical protein S40285_02902 [Stachybotrys chlorohalonata IBT 40285]